jgi:hypothetical protein
MVGQWVRCPLPPDYLDSGIIKPEYREKELIPFMERHYDSVQREREYNIARKRRAQEESRRRLRKAGVDVSKFANTGTDFPTGAPPAEGSSSSSSSSSGGGEKPTVQSMENLLHTGLMKKTRSAEVQRSGRIIGSRLAFMRNVDNADLRLKGGVSVIEAIDEALVRFPKNADVIDTLSKLRHQLNAFCEEISAGKTVPNGKEEVQQQQSCNSSSSSSSGNLQEQENVSSSKKTEEDQTPCHQQH